MRLLTLSLGAIIVSGCATQYKEVKIPVKCEIPPRIKPAQKGSEVEQLKAILIYAEGLERDLKFCRGE